MQSLSDYAEKQNDRIKSLLNEGEKVRAACPNLRVMVGMRSLIVTLVFAVIAIIGMVAKSMTDSTQLKAVCEAMFWVGVLVVVITSVMRPRVLVAVTENRVLAVTRTYFGKWKVMREFDRKTVDAAAFAVSRRLILQLKAPGDEQGLRLYGGVKPLLQEVFDELGLKVEKITSKPA